MRPRVLLDVDGPLTGGFVDAVCARLRAFGLEAEPSMVREWLGAPGAVERCFGAATSEAREALAAMKAAGVAAAFEPRPGARAFVDGLRSWADVAAVTAPLDGSPTWAHEREVWLRDLLGFDLNHVVSTRDKAHVRGDALVDDRPGHLEGWNREHPSGYVVLWREPHNARSGWAGRSAGDYGDLAATLEKWLRS